MGILKKRDVKGSLISDVRNKHYMRKKAIEACKLLNQFIGDLSVATCMLTLFDSQTNYPDLSDENRLSLHRMCLTYLIITLSKWCELYQRYNIVIPRDMKRKSKDLYGNIKNRGVINFRNYVVGHIWNKKLQRPLSSSEVGNQLKKIFGSDRDSFVKWINNPQNNKFPETVVYIFKGLRDRIQEEYKISNEEIIE